MKISIEVVVNSTLEKVWAAWISSQDITQWNFASDEWCCPSAEIDPAVGGKFSYRMEAKDGSMGFDFAGEFTAIEPKKSIDFKIEDDRVVNVRFIESSNGITVVETFDAENEFSGEQQRQGWLSILKNFKRHVEKSVN